MNIHAFIKNPTDKKYRQYLYYYIRLYLGYLKYYLLFPLLKLKFNSINDTNKITNAIPSFDDILDSTARIFERSNKNKLVPIKTNCDRASTKVDEYWGEHTVAMGVFKSALMSKRNLQWRFDWYPMFKELMNLYSNHNGEVILDYGCGPGNDLVGFSLYSMAQKIIGMDISYKALKLAQERINLHREIDPKRIELIQNSDKIVTIPLKDNSIDFVYSEGVIHHTTNPMGILKEFYRVLKPNAHASIMIYNQRSIFLHLFLAYEEMIVKKKHPGLDIHQVFNKSTDGENCPISKCYHEDDFNRMGKKAGFERCEYLGGYLSKTELDCIEKYLEQAMIDTRLGRTHRQFLKELTYDRGRLPMHQGRYAGIGGIYRFYKEPDNPKD